jgi:rubrerythrin
MSQTIKNLEAAFAGESMANRKYLYFAKHARRLGAENVAQIFEVTAEQETKHAHGHLELLFPPDSLSVETMLQLAIDGETYEYTTMYPEFRNTAMLEGNQAAVNEMDEQIEESKEHAELFSRLLLLKAEKRFAALAKVEQRHAQHYQATLDNLKSNP